MSVLPKFLEGGAYGILNDILSGFHSNEGYATPNHYEVEIFPPAPSSASTSENVSRDAVHGVNKSDLTNISIRASSITLPGRTLTTTPDTNIHGPQRTVADNVSFDDGVNISFQCSADLSERVLMEKWQYAAYNPQTWNMGFYNDYVGTVFIYLLDNQMQRRYGLKLWECFPKTVGPIALSYATNNQLAEFQCSMNFRYWTTADINQQPPSLSDKIGQTIVNTIERNLSRALPAVLRNGLR
jgi:hypothetical protein